MFGNQNTCSCDKKWKLGGQLAPRFFSESRALTNNFPMKWCLRNKHRNSMLMTHHYLDLGTASDWLKKISQVPQPISSSTQFLVVMCHQYGISALVSQASLCGVAKCCLFSEATGSGKVQCISMNVKRKSFWQWVLRITVLHCIFQCKTFFHYIPWHEAQHCQVGEHQWLFLTICPTANPT